jgi:hypothetical protein
VADRGTDILASLTAGSRRANGTSERRQVSTNRYLAHLRTIGWFLADAWRVSKRAVAVAVAGELAYFAIQALAYGLLVSALSNPGSLLESRSTYVAAAILTLGLAVLLVAAEALKFMAQSSKYRIAYEYEVSALERVLRYGHRANRFDKLTIKDLVSRSPQVSARVAMAAVDGVVPAIVGAVASAVMIWMHPWFTVWLVFGLILTAPLHLFVLRRGRSATQDFYSVEGLNYARDAVLFFSGGRAGVSVDGAREITESARPSLKALEARRATPNLTYLVTGGAMSLTLAGLVGYSVIVATTSENPSARLLQIFFILRFLYSGVAGVAGAFSKSHILLPRVEPVMWALREEPPPRAELVIAAEIGADLGEDNFDDR